MMIFLFHLKFLILIDTKKVVIQLSIYIYFCVLSWFHIFIYFHRGFHSLALCFQRVS